MVKKRPVLPGDKPKGGYEVVPGEAEEAEGTIHPPKNTEEVPQPETTSDKQDDK